MENRNGDQKPFNLLSGEKCNDSCHSTWYEARYEKYDKKTKDLNYLDYMLYSKVI